METLLLETDARGVATVTMNRPDVHNAFNLTVVDELHRTFDQLGQDPKVRVVVLQGAGRNFSAGADISWMQQQAHSTPEENADNAARMQAMLAAVDGCPKPVVARIHGAALGGGSGLTCAVDIAVASPRATFGFTEVRLGILPAVISPFVMRRIGYGTARALFLLGSKFPAEEALRIGMIHFMREDLDVEVERVVSELLAGAPGSQGNIKALVSQVWETPFREQGAITARAIASAWASPEGRQGLEAFLEKRKPDWTC